ncbi:hypothetical protein AAMO2058_000279900 [Amorphochlora amoebiformis]|eukprot:1129121-Amorphochlora_amoeboformis.AAC.1
MAAKQLLKEYQAFEAAESEEFEVSNPNDDGNILKWEVMIFGPADGPYEDGMFFVEIEFPDTYPEHPPKKVVMKTKVYHPNIDSQGRICLGEIKEAWNNKMNVKTIIDHMLQLFKHPDPADAINADVAKIMNDKPEEFQKTAKEWTEKYAT